MAAECGPLLEYESALFLELQEEDGLFITARGLSIYRVVINFLRLYCDPATLLIVVNAEKYEEDHIIEKLKMAGVMAPKVLTTEFSSTERETIYLMGGVLFVTSRILVVDMLTKRLPIHLVAGMVVLKAHKIIESCQEAFIVRLYRENNKNGFVKAFSDQPTSFMSGYCKVERVMKNLFVRKLSLWPRFHATIAAVLERHKPDVVELHQQLTPLMLANQTALLDLMDTCLRELRRANPSLDADELTVENCIIKSFSKSLRVQLDPVWHQLSGKTKQLVADLKVLRLILFYLTQYDCVTFYKFLESLRASERDVTRQSLWLFMDATDSLFVHAKERVFSSNYKTKRKKIKKDEEDDPETERSKADKTEELKLEESPKWKLLADVLKEIETDNETNKDLGPGHVLIAAHDERTCYQLKEFLCHGSKVLLTRLLRKITQDPGITRDPSTLPDLPPAGNVICDEEDDTTSVNAAKNTSKPRRGKGHTARGGRKGKREPGQTRIDQDQSEQRSEVSANDEKSNQSTGDAAGKNIILKVDNNETEEAESRVKLLSSPVVIIHPLTGCNDPYSLIKTLYEVEPRYVVLYDAEMEFVRQLEVFKASRPGIPLRVYFIIYSGSVEEQKYLTTLRKEKEAFEKLIKEKATMVVPEEQEGKSEAAMVLSRDPSKATDAVSTRKAGGREVDTKVPRKVIVDMREFRSELPSLIHRRGIDIEPVTLEVGDYILSPDMCVERKSVGDLIGSLNNGRLYSQAVSMTRFYKRPILLIEFDPNKSFSLQAKTSLSNEISIQNVTSKLTLLTLHFPKLRILWCHSPYATAELFDELKVNHPEPDAAIAVTIGTDPSLAADIKYNIGPQDFILKLPGINTKNNRLVMNQVDNIQHICGLPEAKLKEILGNSVNAKALWEFLHADKRGETARAKPGSKR